MTRWFTFEFLVYTFLILTGTSDLTQAPLEVGLPISIATTRRLPADALKELIEFNAQLWQHLFLILDEDFTFIRRRIDVIVVVLDEKFQHHDRRAANIVPPIEL